MKNFCQTFRTTLYGSVILWLLFGCSWPKPKLVNDSSIDYQYTAITGVTVIDGMGNSPKANMVVVLKDELIHDVAELDNYVFPERTKLINGNGKYIMPGLIDMHTHVTVLPIDSNGRLEEHYHKEASLASLKVMLAYGITTVRNPAAPTSDGIELKNLVQSGEALGPEIFTSGAALNRTKAWFGPFVATPTEELVREEVRAQVDAGVDMIKVYSSLTPSLIKVAVEEAHSHNVKVIGHLQNTSWTTGANLGIDYISHAAPWTLEYLAEDIRYPKKDFKPFMQRIYWLKNVDYSSKVFTEMFKALRDNGVCMDPTLVAFHTKFWGDDSAYTHSPDSLLAHSVIRNVWNTATFTDSWNDEDFEHARQQWKKLLELTRLLYENEILLTTGSDFPNPWVLPGKGLHQEMELLYEAGIPILDILKMATYNGALGLGIQDAKGTVEKGKVADLIILSEDPSHDIQNIQFIESVYLKGEVYSPNDLLSN